MNKSKLLTWGLIIILLALGACVWFMFGGINIGSAFSYANAEKYTAGDTVITSPVEALDVNWTEGFVKIEYHAGSDIRVSETSPKQLSDDNRLHWWLDGTTLRIQYAKAGINLAWNLQKTLTVSLPEGTVLKSAGIKATSADMTVSGLVAEEVLLISTSGNITASTVTPTLAVITTSGDQNIRQDSVIDTVALGSTSGNIACTLDVAGSVKIESTSGGIGLTVTDAADTVQMGSTSGNVYPSLASVNKADFSSTSGTITAVIGAFSDLKINSTSGNVTATLPGTPGFTGSISSVSGSFSSDLQLAKNGKTYTCGDGSGTVSIGTTSGDIRILAE